MNSRLFVSCLLTLAVFAHGGEWSEKLNALTDDVKKIKDYMEEKKDEPYNRLTMATKNIGTRLSGSSALESVIDVLEKLLRNQNISYREEEVKVTYWNESTSKAIFTSKTKSRELTIVAYSPSVSGKFKNQILVVKTFEELEDKATEATGKIVVFNQNCKGDYFGCLKYRDDGARKAAKVGAVAVLVSSISSVNNVVHTGYVIYNDKKIPAAAITKEDAAFIETAWNEDKESTVDLEINTETIENKKSRNIIADITGTESPKEILLSGAHTDASHIGEGCANDGVGVNIVFETFIILKKLDLKPKKTLRLALWTAGEQNDKGEREHFQNMESKSTDEKLKLFMKSVRGAFNINGFIINEGGKLESLIKEIFEKFFNDWNLEVYKNVVVNDKTSEWIVGQKVPRMEFSTDVEKYFSVYNSKEDRLNEIKPEDQARAITLWATIFYILGAVELS